MLTLPRAGLATSPFLTNPWWVWQHTGDREGLLWGHPQSLSVVLRNWHGWDFIPIRRMTMLRFTQRVKAWPRSKSGAAGHRCGAEVGLSASKPSLLVSSLTFSSLIFSACEMGQLGRLPHGAVVSIS